MTYPIEYTAFSKKTQNVGRPHAWRDDSELTKFFSEPIEGLQDKDSLSLWSAARFEGNRRCNDGMTSAGLICFDVDRPFRFFGPFFQSAIRALCSCIVHTTFSSENEKLRARVIRPLSRPVSREEYIRLWFWGFDRLIRSGLEGDPSTKDPARMWFVPARAPSGIFHCLISPSLEPLAVDSVLNEIQTKADASVRAMPSGQLKRDSNTKRPSTTYIKTALRRGANQVRLATQGARHTTLRKEAYSLTRFLGKGLDENTLTGELMDAARDVGLPEREAKRVLEDSIRHRGRTQ